MAVPFLLTLRREHITTLDYTIRCLGHLAILRILQGTIIYLTSYKYLKIAVGAFLVTRLGYVFTIQL